VVIDKSGTFAYVAALTFSQVWAYTIDETSGRLSMVQGSPIRSSTGINGMTIDGSGHFLYLSEYSGSATSYVEGFSIDRTSGVLTAVPGSPYSVASQATAVAGDSGGRFVYVSAGGYIVGFTINSASGALTAMPGQQAEVSNLTQYPITSLVVDPQTRYLYASGFYFRDAFVFDLTPDPSFTPGGIVAYTIDASSGALSVVAGSPFAPDNVDRWLSNSWRCCQQLAIDPTGRFLYGTPQSTVTPDAVMGFSVNQASGALTAVPGSPFLLGTLGGTPVRYAGFGNDMYSVDFTPIGIAVDGSGSFAYAVSTAAQLVSLAINPTNGALTGVNNQPGGVVGVAVASPPASSSTLVSLQIAPQNPTVVSRAFVGLQQQVTAQGIFGDNSRRFLTESVIWRSSNPAVATINDQVGSKGLVTTTSSGTTLLTATLGGISGATTLTATPAVQTTVTITPNPVTVPQGTQIQLTATGTWTDASQVDVTSTAVWSSSNPSVAAINANGLVTAVGQGSTTISAKSGETGSVTFTVTATAQTSALPVGVYALLSGNDNTMVSFAINGSTGAVTQGWWGTQWTGAIAIDPSIRFAYVADANGIWAYTINPNSGQLKQIAVARPDYGAWGVTIDGSGRFLYAARPTESLNAYRIDPASGALTLVAGSPFALPHLSPCYPAVIDPSGRFLYAVGVSSIVGFMIDSTTGALTAMSGSPFKSSLNLSGVLVMDPQGRFLYASGSLPTNLRTGTSTTAIEGYAIDSSNGALSTVPGSPFPAVSSLSCCGALAVDGTGRFLYGTVAGWVVATNGIAPMAFGFAVNAANGALASIPGSPFETGPESYLVSYSQVNGYGGIVSDGSGQHVFVSDFNSGLVSYAVNPNSGALTMVSHAGWRGLGGALAVASRPVSATTSNAQGTIAPAATSTAAAHGAAHIPVNVTLNSGAKLDGVSFSMQVTPNGSAPAITATLGFVADTALPAPIINTLGGAGAIGVSWSGLPTSLSGTVHVGDVLVPLPSGAQAGQSYTAQITLAGGISQSNLVSLAPGTSGALNVLLGYMVGDVFPNTSDSVSGFGDSTINTLDLIATLRAATGLPGFTPAKCSDRFDAMDAYPADTATTRGGDGTINTLDLLVVLKRATNLETARPLRAVRGLTCPAATPQEIAPAARYVEPHEAAGLLELVRTADGGVDVYLQARHDLHLSGLAIAFGASDSSAALSWTAGEGTTPSIVDSSLSGSIAAAWLNTLDLAAGGRIRLGHVLPRDIGVSVTVQGALANDQASGQNVKLMVVGDVQRR
jgi:6-phosphogluconolactonase (cycloisomerase 2 family)